MKKISVYISYFDHYAKFHCIMMTALKIIFHIKHSNGGGVERKRAFILKATAFQVFELSLFDHQIHLPKSKIFSRKRFHEKKNF